MAMAMTFNKTQLNSHNSKFLSAPMQGNEDKSTLEDQDRENSHRCRQGCAGGWL